MMKHLLLILFIFSSSVCSAGYVPDHTIPKNSNLKFKNVKDNSGYVYFSGKELIKAKYEITFSRELDSLDLVLFPDKKSLEKLPYVTARKYNEKPAEIHIYNLDEIKNIFSLQTSDINEKFKPISGHGVFEINNLHMGYECDSLWVISHIENVKSFTENKKYVSLRNKKGC